MENYLWYDVRKSPFKIYGIYEAEKKDEIFRRMPEDIAKTVNDGVLGHSKVPAGGRVRFKTNAEKMAIKVKTNEPGQMFLATPLLHAGFDLYIDYEYEAVYA